MRIYLDVCCFNRPYDDQTQARIRLESEAKMLIQQKVKVGECQLIWSSTLDYECDKNPFEEHRHAIGKWRWLAEITVKATPEVIAQALEFVKQGVSNYDALHVASAIAGHADIFITTDDRLIKRIRAACPLAVMLPGEALAHLENWYEN